MENEKKLDKKPLIMVFAGPNGSGKSTVAGYFDNLPNYTNADDVVSSTGMSNMEAAQMTPVLDTAK